LRQLGKQARRVPNTARCRTDTRETRRPRSRQLWQTTITHMNNVKIVVASLRVTSSQVKVCFALLPADQATAAARRGENRNPGPSCGGTGDRGSRVGSRGGRAQLHKPSKVTPRSQPSGNGANRAATAACRVQGPVHGVYVAGALFHPLRHLLVAHSDPTHLLPNVRVAHSLGSCEDIFGACSKVTGEQSKNVGHCRRL
jgi:hypothetical protein